MIAIIDGCGANISSVLYALHRIGAEAELTHDVATIRRASHVILPGVGTAHHAMQKLTRLNLVSIIKQLTQPVLGICLGMQLLFEHSTEGDAACLGIFPGTVRALPPNTGLTLPHMGWNRCQLVQANHPLVNQIPNNSYVYFVHGYAAPINEHTLATATHGTTFSAIVQRDNFFAMQFHPERSSTIGAQLLTNFVAMT